jgi:predicted nucleotidyltransferase
LEERNGAWREGDGKGRGGSVRGAGFSTVAEFARDIHRELARHLASTEVSFRGSLAEGTHDEYSDVDILA